MASDRARVTHDPMRKWRGLIAQQGRVTVEADFNEQVMVDRERDRLLTLDFVGPLGTTALPAPGYAVTVVPGGVPGDLTIGPGALYVGGERLDLDAPVTYATQPEWLDYSNYAALWVPPALPGAGAIELVYLMASEQEVSAVEDPELADVALGGPDTMQRVRIIQRFLRQRLPAAPPKEAGGWWTELAANVRGGAFAGVTFDQASMRLVSTTTLQVSFETAGASGGRAAQPGATSGYLGAENQIIRVLVTGVDGNTPTVVWGFDDASFLYRVRAMFDAATDTTTLTLANPPVDAHHFPAAGQAVELLRDAVQLTPTDYIASPTGFVTTVSRAYDPTTMTLDLTGAPPADYLPPAGLSTAVGPRISALDPVIGVVAGGTPVTVSGTGFTGATAVNFGTNPGTGLLVQSDTQLTVISPAAAQPEAVEVTVVTPLGTSPAAAATQFTYAQPAAPKVAAVTPASGGLSGGTLVTVTGSGFTGATAVTFAANQGFGLVIESDSRLIVYSPAAPGPGTVGVAVVTPEGTSPAGAEFTYAENPPPQVTAVNPPTGGPAGGTRVTITGSGFMGASAVDFGPSNPGTELAVVSDTQLTVTTPPQPAPPANATVDVVVTTSEGSSPAVAGDHFTYTVQVSAVAPAAGPPAGGTTVTLIGTGFMDAAAVYFGTNPGSDIAIVTDTQLTVTVPPGTGTVDVTVTTVGGGSSPPGVGATFAYEPTPQLYLRVWQAMAAHAQDQAAAAGAQGGAAFTFALQGTGVTVTLSSSNGRFNPGDFWRFALRPIAPATVYPARYLVAGQSPEGPRTWICPLALVTWQDTTAGVASLVPQFWNLVTLTNTITTGRPTSGGPTVTAITPTSGVPSGGTLVTLTGTGFLGATLVNFGTVAAASVSILSDTEITVVSPPGSGRVNVSVEASTGTSQSPAPFLYLGVAGISPATGPPGGGTTVTLTGSGFTQATAVNFGGAPGTNLTVVSDTEITVVSPSGSGVVNVTVMTPFGTSAALAQDRFAYVQVTSIMPKVALSGGIQITVTGSGFLAAGVTQVAFGSTLVPANVQSDTTLFAPSPGGFGTRTVNVFSPQFGTTQGGPTIQLAVHS